MSSRGVPPPTLPPGPARFGILLAFPSAVGRPVEVVDRGRKIAAVIQTVNAGDGTVDLAYEFGILAGVRRRTPETKHGTAPTWQWPGADEPPDPEPEPTPNPRRSA